MHPQPGARPSGAEAINKVRDALTQYLSTRDVAYLRVAREQLPRCQTQSDLDALKDLVTCQFQTEHGKCPTTCGSQVSVFVVLVDMLEIQTDR